MTPKFTCLVQIYFSNVWFLQRSRNKLPAARSAQSRAFPISVNGPLSLQFFRPKNLGIISLSITLHIQSLKKTFWHYFQNISKISSHLITSTVTTRVSATIISGLDYCSKLLMVSLLLLLAPSICVRYSSLCSKPCYISFRVKVRTYSGCKTVWSALPSSPFTLSTPCSLCSSHNSLLAIVQTHQSDSHLRVWTGCSLCLEHSLPRYLHA